MEDDYLICLGDILVSLDGDQYTALGIPPSSTIQVVEILSHHLAKVRVLDSGDEWITVRNYQELHSVGFILKKIRHKYLLTPEGVVGYNGNIPREERRND